LCSQVTEIKFAQSFLAKSLIKVGLVPFIGKPEQLHRLVQHRGHAVDRRRVLARSTRDHIFHWCNRNLAAIAKGDEPDLGLISRTTE